MVNGFLSWREDNSGESINLSTNDALLTGYAHTKGMNMDTYRTMYTKVPQTDQRHKGKI